MPYSLVPKDEINMRIKNLQEQLILNQLDGAILTKNVEIYYYSGTMQNSVLFVPVSGDPLLFVKKSVERASWETPLSIEQMTSLKNLPAQIKKKGFEINKLGIELDIIPYNQFDRIQKIFSNTSFSDISNVTRLQRSIKSNYEIDLLRVSAKILKEAILELPNIIKPGMKEIDLTAEMEKFFRERGHIGYVRTRAYNMELVNGVIAAGDSAAVPTSFDGPAGGQGLTTAFPQGSSWKKIEVNEPIIIDIATAVNGYIVDQTRMAVIGDLDEELEKAYQVSLEILKQTERNAKPGTLWSEHYVNALDIVKAAGLGDHFMGYKEDQAKFLGHGVGLELDELPVLAKGLDNPLEVGMVIAIEPKFTFPGKGVIGIENTYVVRKNGLELLSDAPKEIIRIFVSS